MPFEEVQGIAIALGIGLLIGVERERRKAEGGDRQAAGVRTFALIAMLGAATALFGDIELMLGGAGVIALAVASHLRGAPEDRGLTTEIAMLLVFVLGALATREAVLAAGLAATIAVLLAGKERMHEFAREQISEREVADGLLLAAAALVVLPLLPDRTIDPFESLNPRKIWLLVVLAMGVSALGHIALRLVGSRWGMALAGFFAGYVSSTAATAGFGQRVRAQPTLMRTATAAALLANFASLTLLVPLLLAVSSRVLYGLALPLAAAGVPLLLGGLLGLRRPEAPRGRGKAKAEAALPTAETRMFRFSHALYFAAIVGAVMFAAAALNAWLGPRAALAGAIVSAAAELHAAGVTLGELAASGRLDPAAARWGLVGMLGSSALAKSIVAFVSGGAGYGTRVAAGLVAMVGSATAAVLFTPA